LVLKDVGLLTEVVPEPRLHAPHRRGQRIDIVNHVFRPTVEEVAYAQRVVELFQRSDAEGRGAVALEGRLVDLPVIERAREVLQMDEALRLRDRSDGSDDDRDSSAEEGRDDGAF
jgi:hypothetical protein